jgi:hypothetical protein
VTVPSEGRLADVDTAIEAVVAAPSSAVPERLGVLAAAILSHCQGELRTVRSVDDVFGSLRSREGRRFLGICLLRLAGERRELFDDSELRRRTITLFDEVLATDVYPLAGVAEKAQGHEKIDALSAIVPRAVSELAEAIAAVGERADFAQARTELLRVLRSRRVAPFLSPFLPRSLTGPLLEDLLAAVAGLERAEGEAILETYRDAMTAVSEFSEDASAAGTRFAEEFFVPLAATLKERIQRRYDESGVTQPAEVSVQLAGKKYPMHAVGAEFQLLFVVTNSGPGVAFSTEVSVEADEDLAVLRDKVSLGSLAVRDVQIAFPVLVPDEVVREPTSTPTVLFFREEDTQAALENALNDEPGWAGTLTVEPIELDQRDVSAS